MCGFITLHYAPIQIKTPKSNAKIDRQTIEIKKANGKKRKHNNKVRGKTSARQEK